MSVVLGFGVMLDHLGHMTKSNEWYHPICNAPTHELPVESVRGALTKMGRSDESQVTHLRFNSNEV
jgi:hypothetical protein